jgi:hypothetical protein
MVIFIYAFLWNLKDTILSYDDHSIYKLMLAITEQCPIKFIISYYVLSLMKYKFDSFFSPA